MSEPIEPVRKELLPLHPQARRRQLAHLLRHQRSNSTSSFVVARHKKTRTDDIRAGSLLLFCWSVLKLVKRSKDFTAVLSRLDVQKYLRDYAVWIDQKGMPRR